MVRRFLRGSAVLPEGPPVRRWIRLCVIPLQRLTGGVEVRQLVGPPLRPQVRSRPPSASVPPGIAHKGGNYATLGRTQGLDPALVCGACFLNRGPCVRTPRGWCAIRSSPPGVWPWCGRPPLGCGRALSAVSAACPALVRAPPLGVDARCRPGCEFEGALSRRTRVVGTVRGSLTS